MTTAGVKGQAALRRAGGVARRGAALLVASAALVASPRAARGDQAADEAGALFREGAQLRKEGKTREACAKFAQSMKKSEGTGPTAALLLHVADCHEREGKLATALAEFRQASALYQQQRDEVSASECRRRAGELVPRVAQLVLRVERPVSGLVVKRNGQVVEKGQLAARTPVDPGEYVITAEAPGYVPFRTAVVVAPDAREVVANVPALRAVPLPPVSEPPRPRPVAGYVLGGLGIAALGAGATFGMLALSSNKEAEDKCQTEATCSADEATAARDRATTQAWVANVGVGIGLAGVAVATYVLFIAPRGPSSAPSAGAQAGLTISPQPGGLRLGVRF
ncbi:MAG TPA: hypothetical protein VFS43_32580 [Polyangiaceae bacterium]|nr:hypothetical protein [Polyangiaceae bacterium]